MRPFPAPCTVAAILIAAAVTAPGAKRKQTADDTAYQELVNKVGGGDVSIDFRALRLACAKASDCDPSGDSKDVAALNRAVKDGKYEEAVKMALELIKAGYPNIEAHAAAAQAYAALKDEDKAKFHKAVTAALIRSILDSGDGKTKETAFEVICVHEEYIVMSILGLPRLGQQGLLNGKPHSYDVLERADPKSGQQVSVYFNIDAFYPMKGLR